MKAKQPKHFQGTFLYPDLMDQLDPKDPLLLLGKKIPWEQFEKEFTPLYSERGRPAKPIRLMVGLLLLKQLENLSDERVVEEWRRNPYFQAFCGMKEFQWDLPCEPSDFCHFRKRIGIGGMEKIFQVSVAIHGKQAREDEIVVDTTVQEKNITYPTDTKLRLKVIARCWNIAEKEEIKLRRSYRREMKNLVRVIRFQRNKDTRARNAAIRRVRTIANILLRELERKLPAEARERLASDLDLYAKAVNQERNDKNKVYSLHEPEVLCIGKGKERKKYEYGNKVVLAQTVTSCIIVGAQNAFNKYDGDTLTPVLDQIKTTTGQRPKRAYCDRGFRGTKEIGETRIEIPDKPKKKATAHYKRKAKEKFRRRSAIEATISHVKHDFRMLRNYLKGVAGDTMNLLLAAAAYNFHKWMRATARQFFGLLFSSLAYLKFFCLDSSRYFRTAKSHF